MKPEIEGYITKNYYELLKICKKYTKNDDWASELLHDIILQLYDKKEVKLKSLDDNSIKYYIVRIIMMSWCYPTSPFYKKYKKDNNNFVELNEAIQMVSEEFDSDRHKLMDIIENEWTELDWFNKIIFEKYMVMGSLKKVSLDTTIPLTSIADYVRNTKQSIRKNTIYRFNNE
jgi:hypothetical protein